MAERPIRKHVNISARDSAQLELRLHWFARALAERQGYIVALRRLREASGRQVAAVSYELQLPSAVAPAARGRRAVPRRAPPAHHGHSAQIASKSV